MMPAVDLSPVPSDWCQRVRRWAYVNGEYQQVAGCLCGTREKNPESQYNRSAAYRMALVRTTYTEQDFEEVRAFLTQVRAETAGANASLYGAIGRAQFTYQTGRLPTGVDRMRKQRQVQAVELAERAAYELYTAIPVDKQPGREIVTFASAMGGYSMGEGRAERATRLALVDTALAGLVRSQAPLHGTR